MNPNQRERNQRVLKRGKSKFSKHTKHMKKSKSKDKKGKTKGKQKQEKKGKKAGFKHSKKNGIKLSKGIRLFIKSKTEDDDSEKHSSPLSNRIIPSATLAFPTKATRSPTQMIPTTSPLTSSFAEKFHDVQSTLNQIPTPLDNEAVRLTFEPTPGPTQISVQTTERDIDIASTSGSIDLRASVHCMNTSASDARAIVVSFPYQVWSDVELQVADLFQLQNLMVYDAAKQILSCTTEGQQRTRSLFYNNSVSGRDIVGVNADPDDINIGICQFNDLGYRNCALVNGSMTFFVTGTSNVSLRNQSVHENATTDDPFLQAISNLMNSGRYDKNTGRAGIRRVRLVTELSAAQHQEDAYDENIQTSPALSATMISLIVGGCVIIFVAVVTILLICIHKRANNTGMKQLSDITTSVDDSSGSADDENKSKADGAIEVLNVNPDHAELVNDVPFDERLKVEDHRVETPFDEPVYPQRASRIYNAASWKITASL